jgi:hypothetical protein
MALKRCQCGHLVSALNCAAPRLFLSRRPSDKLADAFLNFKVDKRVVQVFRVGVMNNDTRAAHMGADPSNRRGRPGIT